MSAYHFTPSSSSSQVDASIGTYSLQWLLSYDSPTGEDLHSFLYSVGSKHMSARMSNPSTQTAVIVLGAFVFVLLGVAIGLSAMRLPALCGRRKAESVNDAVGGAARDSIQAKDSGPSNAHGWYDCSTGKAMCDAGYISTGGRPCVAGEGGQSVLTTPPAATGHMADALSSYTQDVYPATKSFATNGGKDLWRTLDFIYTGSCIPVGRTTTEGAKNSSVIASPRPDNAATPWLSDAQKDSLSSTREFILAFQAVSTPTLGATKRLTITPSPTPTSTTAACINWNVGAPASTYYTPKYGLIQLPLAENWSSAAGISTSNGMLVGVSVNRYSPPETQERDKDTAYCVVGSGVKEKRALVSMPGVAEYVIKDGMKAEAWVEIAHSDTHYEGGNKLSDYTTADLIQNKCVSTRNVGGPGDGHWHYLARGTGIWMTMGQTATMLNKVDLIRHVMDNWDGRARKITGYNPDPPYSAGTTSMTAVANYPKGLKGSVTDSSKEATWLKVITQCTSPFLVALLAQQCAPGYLSGNDGTDQNMAQSAPIVGDLLKLGTKAFYRAPYGTSTPGTAYCSSQSAGLWWCNGSKLLWPEGPGQIWWGALAPLAPADHFSSVAGTVPTNANAVLKERRALLSWILWACVNGYNFTTNYTKHIAPVQALFHGKTAVQQATMNARLNASIAQIADMARNADDIGLQYMFNAGLDTLQLTRSTLEGMQLGFEILAMTGSVNSRKPTAWACDSPGGDVRYFTRDPLDPTDKGVRMTVVKNTDTVPYSRGPPSEPGPQIYLNANPKVGVSYNIGEPVSMPYYKRADGTFTVPGCASLSGACSAVTPPSGDVMIGQACTHKTSCTDGLQCLGGYCAYASSTICTIGPNTNECQKCGSPMGTETTDCKANHPSGHPGCYAGAAPGCEKSGDNFICKPDCPCFLCG
jgi:hypothetical protein